MENFRHNLLIAIFVLLTLAQNMSSQEAGTNNGLPSISRSTILDDLMKMREEVELTPRELAIRANQLIAQKGTTYVFDICGYLKQNGRPLGRVETEVFQPYAVRMTTAAGTSREFHIRVTEPVLGAGCFTQIAVVRVTSSSMTVIADKKPVTLRRPKEFRLARTKRVDPTLKKVLRSWETPFQMHPVGISPDGLRLYMDAGIDIDERKGSFSEIALELPPAGGARFRARDQLKLPEGQPWRDEYVRFLHGTRAFILHPQFDQPFMVMMATGMFVPPEPIYPIETRTFPERNPTSFEFPGSLEDVRQKVIDIFNDRDLMYSFYSSFTEKDFHFAVESKDNGSLAKSKGIFDDEKNRSDLYLHSFGDYIGLSSLYLGGGSRLRYGAEFQLHFSEAGPNKIRISVITHEPRVYNGTMCCGLHGSKSNVVRVEPSTIEEYKILLFLGRRFGLNDMPMIRYPDGVK